MRLEDVAITELTRLSEQGLYRRLRTIEGAADKFVEVEGRRLLLLCSNNYLGLATRPEVVEAAARAARDYGAGAGASRLISGSLRLHAALEEELAAFKGTEAALLFNSGYHANVGVISTLVGREDAVFSDELNHASIIDGCRLSRARVVVYPHADSAALADLLARTPARRKLIVTDSVFSMDGDRAPLREICELAERHGAWVMVDEAHATGVLGRRGAGLVEELGLEGRVDVQMGTLGKALGSFGAYVAGSRPLIDWLANRARSFVFTTALPPAAVGAARAALHLLQAEPELRVRLHENAQRLWELLRAVGADVPRQASHILPVLVGEERRTMELSEGLLREGVWVQGIRPPTVPPGSSRLRVTATAALQETDWEFVRRAFSRVLGKE
jgi:8-amino-7-oxononanoate synthase